MEHGRGDSVSCTPQGAYLERGRLPQIDPNEPRGYLMGLSGEPSSKKKVAGKPGGDYLSSLRSCSVDLGFRIASCGFSCIFFPRH